MADDSKLLKELQIKSGIVKRYIQDYKFYESDAKKQQEKIEKMKSDSVDNYDIKVRNE